MLEVALALYVANYDRVRVCDAISHAAASVLAGDTAFLCMGMPHEDGVIQSHVNWLARQAIRHYLRANSMIPTVNPVTWMQQQTPGIEYDEVYWRADNERYIRACFAYNLLYMIGWDGKDGPYIDC